MRSDPSETGGLFVGRRPGTGPLHYRGTPQRGGEARQHADKALANLMVMAMVALSLVCWGPVPIGCLWVGSQVDYATGSVSLGILLAFVTLGVLLFSLLAILRRIDVAWVLVRRAAGYDQHGGILGRIFAVTVSICACAFIFWFVVIHGPGAG